LRFAKENFQALLCPLVTVDAAPDKSAALSDFIEQLALERALELGDARELCLGLVQVAKLPLEAALDTLNDLSQAIDRSDVAGVRVGAATALSVMRFECEHSRCSGQTGAHLTRLREFLRRGGSVSLGAARPDVQSQLLVLSRSVNTLRRIFAESAEELRVVSFGEFGIRAIHGRRFAVAVPGTATRNGDTIWIEGVSRLAKVFGSAKRPRRIRLLGRDGAHKYLLKTGDLRVDDRIHQFFELFSSVLREDRLSFERQARIAGAGSCVLTAPVTVPLTSDVGLICWERGSETLGSMIGWYRHVAVGPRRSGDEMSLLAAWLGTEQAGRGQAGREQTVYLSGPQKLELHRALCNVSSGNDLAEALWLRSAGPEAWAKAVWQFSVTSAGNSVIGWLLGSGDRHPANILLRKSTGVCVHIDFSDCFEKSMLRRFLPERVPFRLTRMIRRAFGPTGIEGVYRRTSEYLTELLRRKRRAILVFLDVFVKDPVNGAIWDRDNPEDTAVESLAKQAIGTIARKLAGVHEGREIEVADQVNALVTTAMDDCNLSGMYYGWCPYW
jgi:phosphatidylinositol kinase/protein kinase (PI-3  family)